MQWSMAGLLVNGEEGAVVFRFQINKSFLAPKYTVMLGAVLIVS